MMSALYIITPVFNEAGNIPRLFEAFRDLHQRYAECYRVTIIIVNDGSTDDTLAQIEAHKGELPVQILSHVINYGPGRAFGTAFSYLADKLQPDDWVLTMEGDNTSRHQTVQTMLRRAVEEGYQVILASPYMYGGGVINTTSLRVILSKVANQFVKEAMGVHGIFTTSSFFRLYRGEVILVLQQHYGPAIIERDGFECMLEVLIKMMNLGVSISEVPMVLDTSLRVGRSKMKILRTIRGYFAIFGRLKHWRRDAQDKQRVMV